MGLVIVCRKQEVLCDSPTPVSESPTLTRGDAQVCGWERGRESQTHHPGCSLLRFTFPAEPGSGWHLDDAIASWGWGRRVREQICQQWFFPE